MFPASPSHTYRSARSDICSHLNCKNNSTTVNTKSKAEIELLEPSIPPEGCRTEFELWLCELYSVARSEERLLHFLFFTCYLCVAEVMNRGWGIGVRNTFCLTLIKIYESISYKEQSLLNSCIGPFLLSLLLLSHIFREQIQSKLIIMYVACRRYLERNLIVYVKFHISMKWYWRGTLSWEWWQENSIQSFTPLSECWEK